MKEKFMAVCDTEEGYAFRMSEYLLERVKLPYTVHLFTEVEELERFAGLEEIAVLLIAESAFQLLHAEFVRKLSARLIILQESEFADKGEFCCVDKYQNPERVVQEILEALAEMGDFKGIPEAQEMGTKMIGIYSPVKRCLQTSFALTMGQILAKEHRTLYLNFEMYSGLGELLHREFETDMTDVVYYFQSARDKLALRLPAIMQKVGGLDYIPPMQYALGLREVPGEQWIALCKNIAAIGEYEYLVLDLDEGMDGLFELLRNCGKIYTIVKEDSFAAAKVRQYEQTLFQNGMEDIAEKTVKCRFPIFQELPLNLDMMTHGELAGYVRAIVKDDLLK